MTENGFAQLLKAYLAEKLAGFEVTTKEALLYKVIVSGEGDYYPRGPQESAAGKACV